MNFFICIQMKRKNKNINFDRKNVTSSMWDLFMEEGKYALKILILFYIHYRFYNGKSARSFTLQLAKLMKQ